MLAFQPISNSSSIKSAPAKQNQSQTSLLLHASVGHPALLGALQTGADRQFPEHVLAFDPGHVVQPLTGALSKVAVRQGQGVRHQGGGIRVVVDSHAVL